LHVVYSVHDGVPPRVRAANTHSGAGVDAVNETQRQIFIPGLPWGALNPQDVSRCKDFGGGWSPLLLGWPKVQALCLVGPMEYATYAHGDVSFDDSQDEIALAAGVR